MNQGESYRYADQENVIIDESRVPEVFRPLLPFARQWSIGDDGIRTRIMEKTPTAELEAFVQAVSPYLNDIWEWTKSFHDQEAFPIPDEVVVFEMIFEPCVEAELLLEERKR